MSEATRFWFGMTGKLVVCCHCEQSPGLRRAMIVNPETITSRNPKQEVVCVCGARYEVEIRVREVAP